MTPPSRLLARAATQWMAFENRSFAFLMKYERRWRRIPTHLRLQPSNFDRQMFRLCVGAFTCLALFTLLPSRRVRVIAILVMFLLLFLTVMGLSLRDTFPRGKR